MACETPLNLPETLSALMRERSLVEALAHVEATLRRKPRLEGHLLRLDLLCLLGDWDRAARQGEVCTRFDISCLPLMTLVQALTTCEQQREAVFAGTAQPELPVNAPSWTKLQLDALRQQGRGFVDEADALREAAFAMAPESPGLCETSGGDKVAFGWITDSDTRIGPMLEVFTQDRYQWLPFCMLEELDIAEPCALRDFVWLPASFVMEGSRWHGFLPGRYPGSAMAGNALALGRETRWQDVGKTGVFGTGQKVLGTDAADCPLYDLRVLRMNPVGAA